MKTKNQRNSDCHRGWLSTALQHPQVLDHASYFFTDWLIFKLLSFNIFQDRQNTDRNIDQWEASIIFLSANKIQLCDREPTLLKKKIQEIFPKSKGNIPKKHKRWLEADAGSQSCRKYSPFHTIARSQASRIESLLWGLPANLGYFNNKQTSLLT